MDNKNLSGKYDIDKLDNIDIDSVYVLCVKLLSVLYC